MADATEWACTDCGERYPKRSPPCSRCGSLDFEQVAFTPDPEPADAGLSRRGLVARGAGTLAAVSVVTGTAAELVGVTDWTPLGGAAGASDGPLATPPATPEVLIANFVTEYETYGDVEENAVERANAGDPLLFGFRYVCGVRDGRLHVTERVALQDESGTDLAADSTTYEKTYDDRGPSTQFEHTFLFITRGYEPGTYTASVTVRDEVTGEESAPVTASVELT